MPSRASTDPACDDADYRPRVKLTQTDTGLAA